MRILVVEDDPVLAEGLRRGLEREGYSVEVAQDGDSGLELGLMHPFGVIVLDVMLPRKDGFSVCRELRASGVAIPVLMLTARDAVEDRVKGLDSGADDYLPKPFDIRELLARVRALRRREQPSKGDLLRVADLEIDTVGCVARRADRDLHLTPREFELLEALARNTGRVLTRDAILERVWNNEEALPNTVSFHVASLRRKVDADHEIKLIHTVHGLGYRMAVDG